MTHIGSSYFYWKILISCELKHMRRIWALLKLDFSCSALSCPVLAAAERTSYADLYSLTNGFTSWSSMVIFLIVTSFNSWSLLLHRSVAALCGSYRYSWEYSGLCSIISSQWALNVTYPTLYLKRHIAFWCIGSITSDWGKCKCRVILADVSSKFFSRGLLVIVQIFQESRRFS